MQIQKFEKTHNFAMLGNKSVISEKILIDVSLCSGHDLQYAIIYLYFWTARILQICQNSVISIFSQKFPIFVSANLKNFFFEILSFLCSKNQKEISQN